MLRDLAVAAVNLNEHWWLVSMCLHHAFSEELAWLAQVSAVYASELDVDAHLNAALLHCFCCPWEGLVLILLAFVTCVFEIELVLVVAMGQTRNELAKV